MEKKQNLRFLMALGGQKIIVLQDEENVHIYTDKRSERSNVSAERVSALIHSK